MTKQWGWTAACALTMLGACGGDTEEPFNVHKDASAPTTMDAGSDPTKPRMDATTPSTTVDAALADASIAEAPVCTGASPLGCLSATGVRNGQPFSCPTSGWTTSYSPLGKRSWIFACDDAAGELSLRLQFPTQVGGALFLATTPGDPGDLVFAVRSFTDDAAKTVGGMTERSSNLSMGKLTGTVGLDDDSLIGAFEATWDKPQPGCINGYDDSPCSEGSLKISFFVTQPHEE